MIRWKGLIFIVGLAALFFVLSLFFTDRWLENRLEEVGSATVGAKVEIDQLDFSFVPTKLKWRRLQVTNPKQTMQNLFETGACEVKIKFWPLLTRHLIVDNVQISNLRMYTPRQTDGKIERRPLVKKESFIGRSLTKLKEETRSYSLERLGNIKQQINMDSLVNRLQLQSPQKIDSLKALSRQRYADWENKLKTLNMQQDMATIRTSLQTVDPQKIKKLDQLLKALDKVKKASKAAKNLQKTWNDVTVNLNQDLESIRESYQSVNGWIATDVATAKSLAHIPNISTQNISRFLFGKKIVNQISQYLGYLSTARYYAKKYQALKPPKEEKPPRFKGQDIHLYGPGLRPDFWIHRIYLSGQTNDGLAVSGKVKNLVSNQKLVDKLTSVNIKSSSGKRQLNLTALFDYRKEVVAENFRLTYLNFPLKDYSVLKSSALTVTVKKGSGNLKSNFNLSGDKISGEIDFTMKNMQLAKISKSKAVVYHLISEALANTPKWMVKARLTGSVRDLRLSMHSNLDELLAQQLRRQVGKKLQKQEQRLRQKIDEAVQPRLKELTALREKKEKALQERVKQYDQLIQKQLAEIDKKKKEIERRIEKEKSRLGKDALKKLKGIF